MADAEPQSDLEIRERSLANIRDALATLQRVPAAGLDAEKHKTLRSMVDDPNERESINMRCSIDGLSVSTGRRDEEWCSTEVLVSPTNNDRMRPGGKRRAHDRPASWLDTQEHHFPRSEPDDVRLD